MPFTMYNQSNIPDQDFNWGIFQGEMSGDVRYRRS